MTLSRQSFISAHWQRQTAISSHEADISYQELRQYIKQCRRVLSAKGVVSGSRVSVAMPNSVELIILILALLELNAVIAPVNSRWPEAKIIDWEKQIRADFHLEWEVDTVFISDYSNLEVIPCLWQAEKYILKPVSCLFPAFLVATSGSTNSEKAVWLALSQFLYSANGCQEVLPLGIGDRWWLSLPLCHVGGLSILFRCFRQGATVVMNHASLPSDDVTHLSVVPTQLYRWLANYSHKPLKKRLKAVVVGGAACSESLVEKALAFRIPLYLTYGLTEMASMVTLVEAGSRCSFASVGKPIPYRQVRISDSGEIEVKGKTLFQGYLGKSGELLRVTSGDWFSSGDLGSMVNGELVVKGRRDNCFVSAGENIQPEFLEEYLKQLDVIDDAVVVPIEDAEYGQVPVALVSTVAESAITQPELETYLRQYFSGIWMPKKWLRLPDPSGSLKWKRKALQAQVSQLPDLFDDQNRA